MTNDPYASPTSSAVSMNYSSNVVVADEVMAELAATKPWVRFMSVMLWIGAGFLVLIGLVMLLGGGAMWTSVNGVKTTTSLNAPNMMGFMVGMAIFYVLLAFLYIYPAMKLWKYASRIGDLLAAPSSMGLAAALKEQKSFWKFLGIMVIAIFVLYFVIIIAAVAFGGFAAMQAAGR
jgi:Family of unknown function (DUF5362)